uniref:NADH dehydrogenase subunit 6 n=1 Tax=Onchidella borealis TaxID=244421 RepID=E6Y1C0_9EUPU|nr:NADH dehydrogenase subunit 6 [Onchidella borealis]
MFFMVSMLLLFMMSLMPLMNTSLSLGGLLISVSIFVVTKINFMSSPWYSYILFLVYVGGLLVLFIYMCLVSSNFPFFKHYTQAWVSLAWCILFMVISPEPMVKGHMGVSQFEAGSMMPLSAVIILIVVLLIAFVSVVRVVTANGSMKVNVVV